MKGSMLLGIVMAAVGFLLWAASYLYFRRILKPLQLGDRKETPISPQAKKRPCAFTTPCWPSPVSWPSPDA